MGLCLSTQSFLIELISNFVTLFNGVKVKMLIKSSVVLGAILGAIFGVIMLIPFIKCLVCFSFIIIGGIVVFYLKKNAFAGILSIQDGALIGAVSGFVALIAGSIIYLPIEYLISLIFSHTPKAAFNLGTSLLVGSYSIFVWAMLVFFVALLSALFNAFSGLIVAYIYQRIEENPLQDDDIGFVIEQ